MTIFPIRITAALLIPLLMALPVLGSEGQAGAVTMGKFLGGKPTEYPSWFKESFLELAEDLDEARAHGRRVLILFTQDSCPYCHALVDRNLSQKDIEETMRAHFDVVLINMWGDREVYAVGGKHYTEKQFAAAMKVQFTPTLVFLGDDGKPVLRLNGYLPPDRFKLALQFVAENHFRNGNFNDYVAANSPPPAAGELASEDFFKPGPHDLSKIASGIAVFFEQPQCPACDTLHQGPLTNPDTRRIAAELHSIQLDMWSDEAVVTPDGRQLSVRDWARELDVKYAPSIVVFDQGKEVIRGEAFFKTFHTQGILEYARSGEYRDQPSFQRWLEARADHFRELGQDVNIWE